MLRNRFLGILFAFLLAGFLAQGLKVLGSSPIAPIPNSNFLVSIQQIDVEALDFVLDDTSQTLYVSVSGNDPVYGNSVLPIAMPTGTIGISIPVGLNPQRLALADDGATLYVGMTGESSVQRVNVISGTVDLNFALGTSAPCGEILIEDMIIPAGQTDTVIIARKYAGCSPGHAGVAVYDNGVKRPDTTPGHTGSTQIEPSALITTVYGFNNETSEFGFRHLVVDEQGIHEQLVQAGLLSGHGVEISFFDGLIYATNGAIIDPEAGTQVGSFPVEGPLDIHEGLNQIVFLKPADAPPHYPGSMEIFDLTTRQHLASIPLTGIEASPVRFARVNESHFVLTTWDADLFLIEVTELANTNHLPIVPNVYCRAPFIDDFSNPASGWPVGTSGSIIYRYVNGEYNILHQQANVWTAVTRGHYWQDSRQLEIMGRVANGDSVWGLLFGLNSNWSHFYTFEILPESHAWAWLEFTNAGGWRVITNGTNPNILGGAADNHLVMKENFGTTQFFVNGVLLMTIDPVPGRVGFTGGAFSNHTDIRYDDYLFADATCPLPTETNGENLVEQYFTVTRPEREALLPEE